MSTRVAQVPALGLRREVSSSIAPTLALTAIVALSIAIRGMLASRTNLPWIFPDELIYSELAQSIAWLGESSIRGVSTLQFGLGYPVLLAPAYALAGDPVHGYELAKLANAVLMSLAAVPVYLLSRRLLEPWPSVLVSALSVAIPSYAYTGLVLTENAFYPAFVTSVLAMVLALERPSAWRQLAVLLAVALTFAVRAQGLVLLPAFLGTVLVIGALDARRDGAVTASAVLARLDRFRLTWLAVSTAALALLTVQSFRGGSPRAILGVYSDVVGNVSVGGLLEWFVYHAGEIDLYLGVVPFAASALVLAVSLRDRVARREVQVVAVVSACAFLAMLLVVAAVSSKPYVGDASPARLRERNLFHVAPLFLLGFVYWLGAGPRRGRLAVAAAALAAVLPMTVPYGSSFVHASFQALAVSPWAAFGSGGALIGASIFALAAAALFAVAPPRWAPFMVAFVAANFLVVSFVGVTVLQRTAEQTRAHSLGTNRADWIDEAAGGRRVAAVWAPDRRWSREQEHWSARGMWIGELFNRSVASVYHLGRPLPYGLASAPLGVRPDGTVVRKLSGAPLTGQDVLAPCSLNVRGRLIAVDRAAGLGLYRIEGPLRLALGEEAGGCSPAQ